MEPFDVVDYALIGTVTGVSRASLRHPENPEVVVIISGENMIAVYDRHQCDWLIKALEQCRDEAWPVT